MPVETRTERSDRLKLEAAAKGDQEWLDDKPNRIIRRYKNIRKINSSLAARMLQENPSLADIK